MLSLLTARWCLDFETQRPHQTESERLFLLLYAAISLLWKSYAIRKAVVSRHQFRCWTRVSGPCPCRYLPFLLVDGTRWARPWCTLVTLSGPGDRVLCMSVESELLSLWALDLKQEKFHNQGKSNVVLKARWGHPQLGFQKLPHLDMGPVGTTTGTLFLMICLCFPIPLDSEVFFPYLLEL